MAVAIAGDADTGRDGDDGGELTVFDRHPRAAFGSPQAARRTDHTIGATNITSEANSSHAAAATTTEHNELICIRYDLPAETYRTSSDQEQTRRRSANTEAERRLLLRTL